MPVKAVLARLVAGGYLKADSADGLVREWAADLATLKGSRVVERVARRLAGRENREHLVTPPPLPTGEARALRALRRFADDLRPGAPEELAPSFVGFALAKGGPELNRAVAERISQPHDSDYWKGGVKSEIDWSWPIFARGYVEDDDLAARTDHRANHDARRGGAPAADVAPARPAREPSRAGFDLQRAGVNPALAPRVVQHAVDKLGPMMAAASAHTATTMNGVVDNQAILGQVLVQVQRDMAQIDAKVNGVRARLRSQQGNGAPSLLRSVR